jgi:hypothetical protein
MSDREAPKPVSPALVPLLLIRLGVRVLPGGLRRERYRQEFLAELHGMSGREQTLHAFQIVGSSWSLRSATTNPQREETTMLSMIRTKPPLCLLNIRHHWEGQSSPDGDRYERCSKCGKDRMDYPWGIDPKGRNTIGG